MSSSQLSSQNQGGNNGGSNSNTNNNNANNSNPNNNNSSSSSSQNAQKQAVYKKIGPYSLIKEIGQGSFARVYKGRTETNGVQEEFAIKMISKGHLREDNLELIDKEISILLQLKHKNIIKLIDFKKTANNWYLIFEYCELGDLEQYMKEKFQGKFPLQIALMFIQQLSSAFQEIRRLKIVHRDLKLANILLTKDLTVKLGDFGFAKHFDDNSLLVSYCGTPITMAPEILKRDKYNEKCDIWSLGIIIYQMIYGKPPFNPPKGAHIQDLINLIESNQINWNGAYITNEVKDLILKMLVTDPNNRLGFEEFFEHPCMQPEYLQTMISPSLQSNNNLSHTNPSEIEINNDKNQASPKSNLKNNDNIGKNENNNNSNTVIENGAGINKISDDKEEERNEIIPNQPNQDIHTEPKKNNKENEQQQQQRKNSMPQQQQQQQQQSQIEEVMEVKEKVNRGLEYIQERLHEILNKDLNGFLERMQEYKINAQQLSSDNSTEFSYPCAWSSLLIAILQTIKTLENHLEINLVFQSQNQENEVKQQQQEGDQVQEQEDKRIKQMEQFKIGLPKSIQEKLIELSKQLNMQIKSIRMDSCEQQKNTDVYNMLLGNLLHYADYYLLNEFLNEPHVQIKYYKRCMLLCELLLSIKDNVFGKIVITIHDPTLLITKQDIQKIIQIPYKDHSNSTDSSSSSNNNNNNKNDNINNNNNKNENTIYNNKNENNNNNNNNYNGNRNLKRMSLIKKIITIEKVNTTTNYLEVMKIEEMTEEIKTQYEIYQGRYEACLQKINSES